LKIDKYLNKLRRTNKVFQFLGHPVDAKRSMINEYYILTYFFFPLSPAKQMRNLT